MENELKRGRGKIEGCLNGNIDRKRNRDDSVTHHATTETDSTKPDASIAHISVTKTDPSFMASMTFASSGGAGATRGGCDCDECDGPGAGFFTPQAIIDAIRAHKRKRKEYHPMKRTQQRELVVRHGPIAVYKWTMPVNADPLVEFGTAHRLIWIRALSKDVR